MNNNEDIPAIIGDQHGVTEVRVTKETVQESDNKKKLAELREKLVRPDMASLFDDNQEPQMVVSTRGLTALMKPMQVGDIIDVTGYKPTGFYALARNLGIKVQVRTKDGKTGMKRIA